MFSGIVEGTAQVTSICREEGNIHFTLSSPFEESLAIDQSIAHNGVCLTVVSLQEDKTYTVTAIQETLDRSNLGFLHVGDFVNVERSMLLNSRLDGHIVQGHVDCTATCVDRREADGSHYFQFKYQVAPDMARKGYTTVEKGSVCINGVSLTVCNSTDDSFEVAIIPYTLEHTNFRYIERGSVVNLEFDIIGKYLAKLKDFD